MSTAAKLKAKARTFEQREQWNSALEVYESLASNPPAGDDVDVGLWNRIGDLYFRTGHSDKAVAAYEKAVEAYKDAGLHNNAIALCNKILRISPGRPVIFLKLGLISAAKGFAADAKTHVTQYLERMQASNQLDAGLDRVVECASAHAGEPAVFAVLVEQVREHAGEELVLDRLMPAYDRLKAEGLDEEAEQAHAILHGASFTIPSGASSASHDAFAVTTAVHSDHADGDSGLLRANPLASAGDHDETAPEEEPLDEIATTADSRIDSDVQLMEIQPLDGFESTDLSDADLDAAADADTPDPSTVDFETRGRIDAADAEIELDGSDYDEPLPLIAFGSRPAVLSDDQAADDPDSDLDLIQPTHPDRPATHGADGEHGADDERDGEELAVRGFASFESPDFEEDESEDLPTLGPSAGPLRQGPSADEEEDGGLGTAELPPQDIPLPHSAAAEREVESPPEPVSPFHFAAAAPAADPESRGLEPGAVPPVGPVPAEDAGEEYVDLAALIFEDEEPGSTRFVVDAEEPSGDEDRDFAEILARFREQVSKNIDVDDDTSHYDLGVAFKEMGLYDEAISEFQTALRAGSNPLATMEMLGVAFIEKGQHAVAWRILDQAARLSGASDPDLVGVLYWIGRCSEVLGRDEAARDSYERVLSVDIRFRDAADRLSALGV
jgi:tetratricopeptide (TPR) repeat protein